MAGRRRVCICLDVYVAAITCASDWLLLLPPTLLLLLLLLPALRLHPTMLCRMLWCMPLPAGLPLTATLLLRPCLLCHMLLLLCM